MEHERSPEEIVEIFTAYVNKKRVDFLKSEFPNADSRTLKEYLSGGSIKESEKIVERFDALLGGYMFAILDQNVRFAHQEVPQQPEWIEGEMMTMQDHFLKAVSVTPKLAWADDLSKLRTFGLEYAKTTGQTIRPILKNALISYIAGHFRDRPTPEPLRFFLQGQEARTKSVVDVQARVEQLLEIYHEKDVQNLVDEGIDPRMAERIIGVDAERRRNESENRSPEDVAVEQAYLERDQQLYQERLSELPEFLEQLDEIVDTFLGRDVYDKIVGTTEQEVSST